MSFDDEYKELVQQDVESIKSICEAEERQINLVAEEEVQQVLNKQKTTKQCT